jgi:hypothetical protein
VDIGLEDLLLGTEGVRERLVFVRMQARMTGILGKK